MPIYEYRCEDCHQVFDVWQKTYEETTRPCPVCGGESERLLSQTSFVLKGGGWYVTEYGNRKDAKEDGSAPAKAAPEGKAEAGAPTAPAAREAATPAPAATADAGASVASPASASENAPKAA